MATRTMSILATRAVVAVCCVGVGYAYSLYYESAGNIDTPAYITITQTGSSYTFTTEDQEIPLQKLNTKDGTHYGVAGVTIDSSMGRFYCIDLGTIGFHANLVGGDDYPDLEITVRSSSNFNGTSNWMYFITDGSSKIYAYKDTSSEGTDGGKWKAGPDSLTMTSTDNGGTRSYNDVAVHVCYGIPAADAIIVDGIGYSNSTERPLPLTDASLVFRAADKVNTDEGSS